MRLPQIFLYQWFLHEAHSLCVYMRRVSIYVSKWAVTINCYSYPLNPPHTHTHIHIQILPILALVPASHLVRTWSSYAICPPRLALIHKTNTPITLIMPTVQQKSKQHTHTHTTMGPTCAGVEPLPDSLVKRGQYVVETEIRSSAIRCIYKRSKLAFILWGGKLWLYVARLDSSHSKSSVYIITMD